MQNKQWILNSFPVGEIKDNDLIFIVLQSSRWLSHDDPFMPTNDYKLSWKNG